MTHCVIPTQKATTDTCAVLDEVALLEYHDAHDLITIGWIHTHPTQSLFMSSVDLHTHLPYQQLLAEAIAVVVAPTDTPTWGFFALTAHGLAALAACAGAGFHQHEEPDLYGTPTHVRTVEGAATVVDLR